METLRESVPATLFLADADVAALADWRTAIDTLRRAYAADVPPESVPPRSMARAPGVWLRSLTAISPLGGYLGCKLIAASPKIRCASYLIALFDQQTMQLHALLDGNRVTGIRTAATAAVAIDALAPQRPLKVAMLGSGFEAGTHLAALAAIRALAQVAVYSPTSANCERFAQRFRDSHGLGMQVAADPQSAVDGADVVICAARARQEAPILHGDWIATGATVASIGSTLPEQREVAASVVQRAQVIVADMPEEVAHESGDMLAATRDGIDFTGKLVSLHDLIAGTCKPRASAGDVVLYKSVGSALQDVVIAEMLLDRARARGLGTPMPVGVLTIAK
jgi:ornithine cyclodeaminase/alanine dehydrogenase